MFSKEDILKWKELKENLYDDGYTISSIGSNGGVFRSRCAKRNNVYFSINEDDYDLTSNISKWSMICILGFLFKKRSQLEKAIPLKCGISIVIDIFNDALFEYNKKINKISTISEGKKMTENITNECQKKGVETVNHPKYYNTASIECIKLMLELYGTEAVKYFCKCNALKYLYRADNKNGLEDIKKAAWYLNKIVEVSEK